MQTLVVWLRLPQGGQIQVGQLISSEPDQKRGGRLQGEFRYDKHYINQTNAFSLDPIHLPLQSGIISADRPYSGIHGVFEDSLPDDWGRKILIKRYNIARPKQRAPTLLKYLGNESLGALAYTKNKQWQTTQFPDETATLSDLIIAAEQFENNQAEHHLNDVIMQQLFQAASSPGGARPKIVLEYDQQYWIAKLPSNKDQMDVVRIEAATLDLAKQSGIIVPDFFVTEVIGRPILLVKRFDITYLEHGKTGRNHVISLQTLLGLDGYYTAGYSDIADIIRTLSDIPERDMELIYKQMLFNAMIANTDDHLKNFSMYRTNKGWELTPAYDLLPDVENRREHVLNFGNTGAIPVKDELIRLGKSFSLSKAKINYYYDEVRTTIEQYHSYLIRHEVPDRDIKIIIDRVKTRLKLLS